MYVDISCAQIMIFGGACYRRINMKEKRTYLNGLDRIATARDMAVYLLAACACILLAALWYGLLGIGGWIPAGVALLLYLGAALWWTHYRMRRDVGIPVFTLGEELGQTLGALLENSESPSVICNTDGRLVWCNALFASLLGDKCPAQGEDVTAVVPFLDTDKRITLGDKMYVTQLTKVRVEDTEYVFAQLRDISALRAVEKAYEDDRIAIGFVSIDNLQDAMQYTTENVNDTLLEVDTKLRRWAMKNNCILMSYDTDKYLLLLDTKKLTECVEDRFSVLDEVRQTRVGDGVSITVSMGIARVGGSLAERERAAEAAHEMALQRGGDQVVLKNGEGVEFFGGRTKAVYKRTNVKARVFSTQLCAEIGRSSNVVIMGHRWGDHDSVGAAIGMAKFVRMCGARYNIVYSKDDKNIAPNIEYARQMDEYRDAFVSGVRAAELLGPKSLLIIVDVSNVDHVEVPELVRHAANIVIVDHHIQPQELGPNIKLAYIEPSASSASELVTEFLEFGLNVKALNKVEAELLFSGIVLDTKQFSKNTGPRTFAAAQYLRGQGAGSADAMDLYRSELDDLTKESRLLSNVEIIKDRIAICACEKPVDESYRVIAAKVADKLLTVKKVEASFTLIKVGDQVIISARSTGTINVQLIMEKCGGGGHFEMAGGQLRGVSVKEAQQKVMRAINSYLNSTAQSEE